MIRHLLITTALTAIGFATFTNDTSAGCSRGHHVSYARPYVRRVQHVVQPVTVVRRTVEVVPPPVIAEPEPTFPSVPAGATLTIPANFLGNDPGSVFMVFRDIKLPVQIHSWNSTGVTITLPPMAIKDAVLIRLDIVLPDGRLGHSQKLNVTAPAPVILHPVAPTSPLPTNAALSSQPNVMSGLLGN